jgi:hypothetical protein
MTEPSTPWIDTEATVTSCRYQFAALNTLAFGVRTQEKFRITFDYYAHGQLYSDEFQSPVAIAQSEHFSIAYNPLNPRENSRSGSAPITGTPIFAIGIAGSILLSLIWLAILRSCN